MFFSDSTIFLQDVTDKQNILGLDLGIAKIGTAIFNRKVKVAVSYKLIIRKTFSKDIIMIKNIIEEHNIGGLVIGLPLDMNGHLGNAARKIKKLSTDIVEKGNIRLPIYFEDERMTTALVKKTMPKRRGKKLHDDCNAASLILGSFISRCIG